MSFYRNEQVLKTHIEADGAEWCRITWRRLRGFISGYRDHPRRNKRAGQIRAEDHLNVDRRSYLWRTVITLGDCYR